MYLLRLEKSELPNPELTARELEQTQAEVAMVNELSVEVSKNYEQLQKEQRKQADLYLDSLELTLSFVMHHGSNSTVDTARRRRRPTKSASNTNVVITRFSGCPRSS